MFEKWYGTLVLLLSFANKCSSVAENLKLIPKQTTGGFWVANVTQKRTDLRISTPVDPRGLSAPVSALGHCWTSLSQTRNLGCFTHVFRLIELMVSLPDVFRLPASSNWTNVRRIVSGWPLPASNCQMLICHQKWSPGRCRDCGPHAKVVGSGSTPQSSH